MTKKAALLRGCAAFLFFPNGPPIVSRSSIGVFEFEEAGVRHAVD
jgi:hypothetical protein